MAVTGSFKALAQLRGQLAHMATPAWRRGLSANLGEEALEQVAEGFASERDPYGRPWPKSIRAKVEGGQTLSKKAILRRSFSRARLDAHPGGFSFGSNVAYAIVHQKGAVIKPKKGKGLRFKVGGQWRTVKQVRIPVRQMVPEGNLGPIWQDALEKAATAYIEETFQ